MITDPVNVGAKQHGEASHRVTRGASSGSERAADDEGGHYRYSRNPRLSSEDDGLRLSLTLPCNSAGGVVE